MPGNWSQILRRLLAGEPVSDRYLLESAWFMRDIETPVGTENGWDESHGSASLLLKPGAE